MSEISPLPRDDRQGTSRRQMLGAAAGATLLGSLATQAASAAETKKPRNGRIKQSLVHWCYAETWDVPEMCKVAKDLGCGSIELIDPKYFPVLKEHGLTCAIGTIDMAPEPPFTQGFNNPKHRDKVMKATKEAIDACSAFGCKNVITFTGMADGISREQGAANCVEAYKEIVPYAAAKNVTLCLEMLNTRATDHPMKGHPGYQGNDTEYCVDIINRVGSPNLKLLFDFYHVQIMNGDLIRRLHQHKDVIGHIHTAGNPGRGELDEKQEISYPALMHALLEIGYDGFVGQEFIPTRNTLAGLEQAVTLCDV
ncbi:TIM barrel protein [Isosphaeraceae bacterium EP7]